MFHNLETITVDQSRAYERQVVSVPGIRGPSADQGRFQHIHTQAKNSARKRVLGTMWTASGEKGRSNLQNIPFSVVEHVHAQKGRQVCINANINADAMNID